MIKQPALGRSVVYAALFAGLLGLLVPSLFTYVEQAGHQITTDDVAMDYVIAIGWGLLLGLSILVWPIAPRYKAMLLLVWAAKVFVTLIAMLPYEDHYILDTYYYFDLGGRPPSSWPPLSLGGTGLTVVLSWFHRNLLVDSFHATKLTFAMLGLVGTFLFYRAMSVAFGRDDRKLFYLMALLPSVLFWSSILGKDPVAFFAISLHAYGFVLLYRTRQAKYVIPLVAGLAMAALVRLWLGGILLAPLLVIAAFKTRGPVMRTYATLFALASFLLAVGFLLDDLRVSSGEDLLATATAIGENFSQGSTPEPVSTDFRSGWQFVAFLPLGALSALFRPLPGEVMNPFGLIAGLENAFLIALAWLAVRRRRLSLRDPVVLWATMLVLTWAAAYGVVSYQNLGAAVRFKLQILPILVALTLASSSEPVGPVPELIAGGGPVDPAQSDADRSDIRRR